MLYSDSEFLIVLQQAVVSKFRDSNASVDTICKHIYLSRSQVHRRVKAITGLSTTLYIRKVKLEIAKNMLSEDSITIKEIAINVGIRNPQNFSKYFKKAYGVCPSRFRTLYKSSLDFSMMPL